MGPETGSSVVVCVRLSMAVNGKRRHELAAVSWYRGNKPRRAPDRDGLERMACEDYTRTRDAYERLLGVPR